MDLCSRLMTYNDKNKVSRFVTKRGTWNYHMIEIRLKGDVNQVAWELNLSKGCGEEAPSSLLSIYSFLLPHINSPICSQEINVPK